MKRQVLSVIATLFFCVCVSAENNPKYGAWYWTVVPDHADWLYETGEKASLKITLLHAGVPVDGKVSYTIDNDMIPTGVSGEVMLRKGEGTINLGTSRVPGFKTARLRYIDAEGEVHKHHIKIGYDVDKIVPLTQMPEDFDEFWAKAREEVNTPLEYTKELLPEFCDEISDCWLVRLKTVGKHCIYGYLYIPKGAQKGTLPVMITPPGAGMKGLKGNKNDSAASLGIARFTFEIHGLDPRWDPDAIYQPLLDAFCSELPHSYTRFDIEYRDHYYMRHVYQALIKAVDLMTSLPEWDGKNVYSYGGSQGGALSLIAAGLDKRITACVAKYPALVEIAGYSREGHMGGWPHMKSKEILTPNAISNLAYYDVINFVRKITVPVMLQFGYNDDVCPPTTSYMVWNTLNCEKVKFIMPDCEHWSTPEANKVLYKWLTSEQLAK